MVFLTSRTAALTYQDCPRRRFYLFHVLGTGISGSKPSVDTFIGTTVHRGLQNLLEPARVEHNGDTRTLKRDCINQSVEVARVLFFEMLENSNGIAQKPGDYTPYDFLVTESWNLCEALLRSYALWRLPQFGEFYEVLEVEKEEEFWFENPRPCDICKGEGVLTIRTANIEVKKYELILELDNPSSVNGISYTESKEECKECRGSGEIGGILFQAKADGLLRGRHDNKLYPLSFKTGREFSDLTMKQILHDMQGMSEIAAIEDRLNRISKHMYRLIKDVGDVIWTPESQQILGISKRLFEYLKEKAETDENIVCEAVAYEYLLKGRYQQDPWNSGMFKWQNALIHCWKNEGVLNIFSGNINGLDYKWKPGQGRQPKGWAKIDIWDDMGVEAWIDLLLSHEIQPEEGDPFQHFFRAETIHRDREHILEWKAATFAQERRIRYAVRILDTAPSWDAISPDFMAEHFPKHTNRCHDFYGYNNDCPFTIFCHEGFSVEDLLEQGAFKVRSPHHERERQLFQIEGRSK